LLQKTANNATVPNTKLPTPVYDKTIFGKYEKRHQVNN